MSSHPSPPSAWSWSCTPIIRIPAITCSWWRRPLYGLSAERCHLGVRGWWQGHVMRRLRLCPSRWRRRRPIRDLAERLRRRDRRRWRRGRGRDDEHGPPWWRRRRVHRDRRFRCWKRRRIWSIAARQGRGRPGRRAQPARQDLGDPVHWSWRRRVSSQHQSLSACTGHQFQ